jgi:hypothetical protein
LNLWPPWFCFIPGNRWRSLADIFPWHNCNQCVLDEIICHVNVCPDRLSYDSRRNSFIIRCISLGSKQSRWDQKHFHETWNIKCGNPEARI